MLHNFTYKWNFKKLKHMKLEICRCRAQTVSLVARALLCLGVGTNGTWACPRRSRDHGVT